ncbi:murein biosynthesis integral membrane protein MurJ [Dermabacteraceae bacterium P13101]
MTPRGRTPRKRPRRYIGKHEPDFNPELKPFSAVLEAQGELAQGAPSPEEPRISSPRGRSKDDPASRSFLLRASAIMAAGTIVSRVLGFVKNFLMGMVFGGSQTIAADAFSAANVLPNSVWILVGGGTLNAILVPAVVRAMKNHDGGADYISRLMTLVMLLAGGLTVLCTLAVPLLLPIANGVLPAEKYVLALTLGYWLMPQIVFSAFYVLCGHILNAHNAFAAYAWAPALNNVVAIIGAVAFLFMYGTQTGQHGWTMSMVVTLAIINLGGSTAQGVLVWIAIRGLGLKLRPKWGFRGMGLTKLGKIGGWSIAMLTLGQVAVFATRWSTTTASQTSERLQRAGDAAYVSYPAISAIDNSYLAFMLPQSIITVSLVTAIFPAISRSAAAQDHAQAHNQYTQMSRMLAIPMMLCTVLFSVLAAPVMWVIVGRSGQQGSIALGWVLAAYMIGLVPFAATYLMKRMFYAYEDARTPFLMQIPITLTSLMAVWPILHFVDPRWATATAALVSSLGTCFAWILGAWVLSRQLRERGLKMDIMPSVFVYLKLIAASLASALVGLGALWLVWEYVWLNRLTAVLLGSVVGAVITAVFVGITLLLKVQELDAVMATLKRKVLRRA